MITRRSLMGFFGAVILAVSTPVTVAASDPTGDPDKWAIDLSNEILNLIRSDAQLAAADPARVRKFVAEKVMPNVDFLRMTRMSVGPKWKTATDAQKEELQQEFRETLTRVYSGALTSVKDQVAKLAPNRVKPTEKDAVVRTLMVASGKPDIRINYRLKKLEGRWRIIDVDVEGIWLVENYRNQFASVINSSGIDGLIRSLKEKNAGAK